jgi:hypothetical protein
MNAKQRRALIYEVKPIVLTHKTRQALHGFRPGMFTAELASAQKVRELCLTPSINVDELASNPSRLMGLLFFRASLEPAKFVRYDYDELHGLWSQLFYSEVYVDGCCVLTGASFGTWKKFDYDEFHSMYSFDGSRALLLLECQERMLKFLWPIVKKILQQKRQPSGHKRLLSLIDTRLCTMQEPVLNFNTTLSYLSPPIFDSMKILEIAQS